MENKWYNPWYISELRTKRRIHLGGVDVLKSGDYVQRVYEELPPHTFVGYAFTLYLFDKWQVGSKLEITFDDKKLVSFDPSSVLPTVGSSYCGDPSSDTNFPITGRFFHSAPNLTINISTSPYNPLAFFGLKNFAITFKQAKQSDTEESCLKISSTSKPGACRCTQQSYYYDRDGGCKPSHESCGYCYGPSASDCSTCYGIRIYHKELDTCIACDSGCALCEQSKCFLCVGAKYSFWNHSCLATCNPPYIKDSVYCKTPCQTNNSFMLWNNSCSDSCNLPFVPRIEGKAQFCDFPCSKSLFLYWNGSCGDICPFYQRYENGYKFCAACQPGNYSFPNLTCLPSCPQPFKPRAEGWSQFCDSPCPSGQKFFHMKNKKCQQTCEYPYRVIDDLFCVLNIPEEEIQKVQTIAGTLSSTQTGTKSAGSSISVLNFGTNPATIFIQVFADMSKYIRYINIKYPPKLQYLFSLKIDPPFEIIPSFPEELLEEIPKYSLAAKFDEDEELHSSFFVNFWSPLITLTLLGLSIFFFGVLQIFIQKLRLLRSFIVKVNNMLRWNYTLTLFTSYFGDIVLFTSLELRTANPNTTLQILSFTICFALNLQAFIAFGKIIRVILVNWECITKEKHGLLSLEMKAEIGRTLTSYEVLFQSLKDKSITQQAFMLIFVLRLYFYVSVISYLFNYPFVQTILIMILNLSMLLYLLFTRPLTSKIDLIHYISQEIIMLILNCSILILSFFDLMNEENISIRETLGDIIINCNFAFSGVMSLYLIIQLLCYLRDGIKFLYIKLTHKRKIMNMTPSGESTSNPTVSQESFVKQIVQGSSDISSSGLQLNVTPTLSSDFTVATLNVNDFPLIHETQNDDAQIARRRMETRITKAKIKFLSAGHYRNQTSFS